MIKIQFSISILITQRKRKYRKRKYFSFESLTISSRFHSLHGVLWWDTRREKDRMGCKWVLPVPPSSLSSAFSWSAQTTPLSLCTSRSSSSHSASSVAMLAAFNARCCRRQVDSRAFTNLTGQVESKCGIVEWYRWKHLHCKLIWITQRTFYKEPSRTYKRMHGFPQTHRFRVTMFKIKNLYTCWLILVRVSVLLVLNTDEVAHMLNVLLKVSDLQLQLMAMEFPFQLLYAETQRKMQQ